MLIEIPFQYFVLLLVFCQHGEYNFMTVNICETKSTFNINPNSQNIEYCQWLISLKVCQIELPSSELCIFESSGQVARVIFKSSLKIVTTSEIENLLSFGF